MLTYLLLQHKSLVSATKLSELYIYSLAAWLWLPKKSFMIQLDFIIEVTIVKVFEKKLSLHQEAKFIRLWSLVSIWFAVWKVLIFDMMLLGLDCTKFGKYAFGYYGTRFGWYVLWIGWSVVSIVKNFTKAMHFMSSNSLKYKKKA